MLNNQYLPHENRPQMPISLGCYLYTRSNFPISNKDAFIALCSKLSQNKEMLSSEIATKLIEHLSISYQSNYSKLTELICTWRNAQNS